MKVTAAEVAPPPPNNGGSEEGVAKARAVDAGQRASADAGGEIDGGAPAPPEAGASEDPRDSGPPAQMDSGPMEESGFCTACDNAAPAPPVLSDSGGTGNVTTLGSVMSPQPSHGGACNYGTTTVEYFAAINANVQAGDAQGQWQGGRICGQCAAVRVKTEEGWKEAVVRIVDKCNDPSCGIALGGAPARDLMGDRPGRYAGSWRFVSCEEQPRVSDGVPSLRVKEGSSQYWALVHVRNPRAAVTGIDWKSLDGTSSGSFAYASEAENYFSVPEAVHMNERIRLSIHYRDTASEDVELSPMQLATAGAEIALP